MVKPIVPQPLTNMGYGGMDFLRKFRNNLYNTNKMKAMNGTTDSNGMPSQGDQELNQRFIQNELTAHHIDPNAAAGDIPFTEPSMEQLVDLIESGKADKSILGEDADRIINDVNTRRNFKLPGEFPGSVEEFDKKYNLKEKEVPSFMEIPVKPFAPEKRDPRDSRYGGPDEDDLAFLQNFTKSMKA